MTHSASHFLCENNRWARCFSADSMTSKSPHRNRGCRASFVALSKSHHQKFWWQLPAVIFDILKTSHLLEQQALLNSNPDYWTSTRALYLLVLPHFLVPRNFEHFNTIVWALFSLTVFSVILERGNAVRRVSRRAVTNHAFCATFHVSPFAPYAFNNFYSTRLFFVYHALETVVCTTPATSFCVV